MNNLLIAITIAGLFLFRPCFAEAPTASQIERTQQLIEQEESLRSAIQKEKKVFIQEISVSGSSLLSAVQIKAIVEPFEKNWLTPLDIQQIIDALEEIYQEKGCLLPEISYEIEGSKLLIKVAEQIK